MGFVSQLKHAWNAFLDDKIEQRYSSYGGTVGYGGRLDRVRLSFSNERTIISSVLTRIAIDAASVVVRHVRTDGEGRYLSEIDSGLNTCLKLEANIDQSASHFRQDIISVMMDRGYVAIVPVDTSVDPSVSGSFDIKTMRVGEIIEWMPRHVRVRVYNDNTGVPEDITLEKKFVAIAENPMYSVMNEPNSTLQRLIAKLSMLDAVDKQSSSGKLDLIIQLPYVVKSEARKQQAENRRKDIEFQLAGSQYGIAYADGTEKITQLNRPAENQLLKQVEYLTAMLYSQLGLTNEILNGTADVKALSNYYNRTIEPLVRAVVESMRRAFLTRTAITQGQTIMAFQDLFKLISVTDLAEVADKLARNEIVSSNEIRQVLGLRPSKDPKADQLRNSNMPQPAEPPPQQLPAGGNILRFQPRLEGRAQNGA
jgi:hypothetical protein